MTQRENETAAAREAAVVATLARTFPGRVCAFVVVPDGMQGSLSIVVDGENGHYPLEVSYRLSGGDPLFISVTGTRGAMQALADRLNHNLLNLSDETVTRLIAQSLRSR